MGKDIVNEVITDSNIEFSDYFDLEKVQSLQDAVAKNQDIASLIVDLNGNNLTKPTHFSVGLIRIVKRNKKADEFFDQGLNKQFKADAKNATVVRNKTGDMMAGVIPIIIHGNKVATWIVGGVFDVETMLPREKYEQLAVDCGEDVTEFMKAIDGVTVMKRAEFLNIFEVVRLIAEQMAEILDQNYTQKNRLNYIEELLNELEETNVALKIQAERYRLLAESSEEVIFDYDVATDTIVIPGNGKSGNAEWVMTDYLKEKKYKTFIHPDDIPVYEKVLENYAMDMDDTQYEMRMNLFSPEYIWSRLNTVTFRDENGKVTRLIGKIQDIEKEKEELMELESQIKKDPMTGLLNKNATKISAEKFFRGEKESTHAVMIVDIDDFKNVNDTFGHLFGDMVIENVAAAISSTFRKSDIIGRIGGDEFMVIMKNTGKRIAEIKARDLDKAVRKSYSSEGKTLEITCSVGIAFFPEDAGSYEELFEKADIAMYNAKMAGKNTVAVYDAEKEQKFAEITKEDARTPRFGSEFGADFTEIAFALLFESKDINTSMKILTERITDKYSIQKLIYNYSEEGVPDYLQVWDCEKSEYVEMSELDFSDYTAGKAKLRQQEYIVINDCAKEEKEADIARFGMTRGMTAIIGINIPVGDNANEYVIFANTDAPRCWTETERKHFKHIAEVFCLFERIKREKDNTVKQLNILASKDQVTGVYNKAGFEDEVIAIMDKYQDSKKYTLAYVDINNFAYINETYGIIAGNKILKDLANVFCSIKDCVVSRIYGDHFVVLYYYDEGFDVLSTYMQQKDIFHKKQQSVYSSGKLDLNAGFVEIMPSDRSISIAIDNANIARKKAKALKGVDHVFFDDDMRKEKEHEQVIASGFERAIEKQQFEMFLQPKMNLVTNTAVGAEALVRWKLQDGSYRMPGEFIPVLEKYNYIQRMDFAMLEMALQTIDGWIKEGLNPVPIAINFSRLNSNSPGFVPMLMNMFREYKVPKQYIEIEVNESALNEGEEALIENLSALKKRGFTTNLDDFGKGASPLESLLTAPIDIVKVDRVIIDGMTDSFIRQDYVSNLCSLVSSVKKRLVFEGVETKEQADFLLSCGIVTAQGYYFGKPMNTEEFAEKYLQF
ncbi:MAG: diguanylate cyclase [Lachnospiraceae bacterium]|nr:diguanylate cyclase [Lachnospiraceae bacterium]